MYIKFGDNLIGMGIRFQKSFEIMKESRCASMGSIYPIFKLNIVVIIVVS